MTTDLGYYGMLPAPTPGGSLLGLAGGALLGLADRALRLPLGRPLLLLLLRLVAFVGLALLGRLAARLGQGPGIELLIEFAAWACSSWQTCSPFRICKSVSPVSSPVFLVENGDTAWAVATAAMAATVAMDPTTAPRRVSCG